MRAGFVPACFVLVASCAPRGGSVERQGTLALPAQSGTIVLTGIDFPDAGTSIGGHYGGASFDVWQFGYQLTESVRARWSRDARSRAEGLLRGAGLRVRSIGTTSD